MDDPQDHEQAALAREKEESALQPAARALLHHMMTTDGGIVTYEEIARVIGSGSTDPRSVVKVHLHSLRRISSRAWMISVVRGRGLRWTSDPTHMDGDSDGTSDRVIGILRSHPGRIFSDEELVEASGSHSNDPSNLIKVLMHRIRNRPNASHEPLPIRRVRGRGLVWGEPVPSIPEHHEGDGKAD